MGLNKLFTIKEMPIFNWGHLDEFCRTLVREVGYDWAWIAGINPENQKLEAISQSLHPVHTAISVAHLMQLDTDGPCFTAMQEMEIFSTRRISNVEKYPEWSCAMSKVGFASYACLPFRLQDGTLIAINLYCHDALVHEKYLFKAIRELYDFFGEDISLANSMKKQPTMELENIGQRIHDGLSQMLTVISMNLSILSKEGATNTNFLLEETLDLANQAIKESRDISFQLRKR